MGCDYLKDLYAEIALLQYVLKRENRVFTRNLVFDHVDFCKTAHRRHDDQIIQRFAQHHPLCRDQK